jgi:hypothetical protein
VLPTVAFLFYFSLVVVHLFIWFLRFLAFIRSCSFVLFNFMYSPFFLLPSPLHFYCWNYLFYIGGFCFFNNSLAFSNPHFFLLVVAEQGAQRSSVPGGTASSTRTPCPSLRYVPVMTHAQRSGTSGGSGRAHGGQRSTTTDMVYDDYDTENSSGQTGVSTTTKNSDYVYFKTPLSSYDVCDV